MSDAPKPPVSEYEAATWAHFLDAFPWRKPAYLAWRDHHRATLARLFADPRIAMNHDAEGIKAAIRAAL